MKNAFFSRTFNDQELNQFSKDVGVFLKELTESNPLFSSVEKSADLVTGNNPIEHGLGRIYKGYLIIKKSNNSQIHDVSLSAFPADKFLVLNSSGSIRVTLLIF